MDSWAGPSHYVSIQHVVKPGSKTTRMRLVINSSLRCPKCGLSLNDMMMKGPNVLPDIWALLMRLGGTGTALSVISVKPTTAFAREC